ncbi:DUF4387 domain-containing protein [Aestuariicoccus sp. MJ-SS9]|uniref:DUF4387 domain-containing protein n=1 Tax=Aestuariicoccus sp. MJ-SS9 TaxID=3079855 RepID=UPI00290963C8|nr:DUF4387 domain-containing protein [Aestuariicoccus sp. MJ-SS9]MDU8910318.1 DUF4387 domain-containing protein [Aestuariicoccus sp. MJ-SS9]
MTALAEVAGKIRSKNAGPFWLTVDIFCETEEAYTRVSNGLSTEAVATRFGIPEDSLRRFDIADLQVVKFSLPRPAIQGTPGDRDMHGASFANLLAGLEV